MMDLVNWLAENDGHWLGAMFFIYFVCECIAIPIKALRSRD